VSSRVLPGIDDARAGSAVLLERQEVAAHAHEAHVAALRGQIAEQGAAVERVAAQVDRGLTALSDWVSLLQKKIEMLALDLREQISTRREPAALPEPRATDREMLRRKLAAMGAGVRVNLGCGERPLDGYVNVDFREAPHVDIVADARRLPFDDESLEEIATSHLVEHFRRHELATVVLPYWRRLLRPGGMLRTVCPNWQEMLRRVQVGEMSLDAFTTVTFGAQDYSGDDHFSMYTPETLREVLAANGFGSIEVVAESRQNGLCPEMEIVARKSGGGS